MNKRHRTIARVIVVVIALSMVATTVIWAIQLSV